MIAYRCLFEPTNLRAVDLIRSGKLGKIQAIESANGFNIRAGEWRLNMKLAGVGPLMDMGVYSLNACRYLTGEEPVEIALMEADTGLVEDEQRVDERRAETACEIDALHLAARGWHVFPITPGAKKPPVIDRWETRASTDPDQINHWWRKVPFTIGIATGPSGVVVVDLDTRKPGETTPDRWATLGIGSGAGVLRALARQRDAAVTPTYAVTTASGGWHLYYTTPPGTQLRNTHDVIGWKIDTRAHGGYVVASGCPVPPG